MTRWRTADVYLRLLPRSNILAHLSCNVGLPKVILVMSEGLEDTTLLPFNVSHIMQCYSSPVTHIVLCRGIENGFSEDCHLQLERIRVLLDSITIKR
jgi:hypothetical protein